MWPETTYGHNPEADGLEVCGGDVTVMVKAINEPYCGEESSPVLSTVWTCNRCKYPWVPGRIELGNRVDTGKLDITRMLEG